MKNKMMMKIEKLKKMKDDMSKKGSKMDEIKKKGKGGYGK
jgi:hypothetical protein